MEREYKFFVTTKEPHQPAGDERGLIRRLVMRNFFETKSGTFNSTSESSSATTVTAGKQLKNRFRVSTLGGHSNAKRKSRKQADNPNQAKRKRRPVTSRTDSGSTNTSRASIVQDVNIDQSSTAESVRCTVDARSEAVIVYRNDRHDMISTSLSADRFDPFDVLPVPGTRQMDTLFRLYRGGSSTNSIAVDAERTWKTFVLNDSGLLHATLATWALYGVLSKGLTSLRIDKLKHKNEAIKEVNSKIARPDGAISDELVGTVLILANFENVFGAYDAAQMHLTALKRMVQARGGISAFEHNDGLIRGIAWVEFHIAAAFRIAPSFPQIQLDPDAAPFPDDLLEEAAYMSPTTLLQLSLAAVECFNIFYRLHRIAVGMSSRWEGRVGRLTLSNLLYEAQFIALSVPDKSRHFLEFDEDDSGVEDEDYLARKKIADAASVVEGILAGVQIFIYAALRSLPPNTRLFSILLDRLRVAIYRAKASVIQVWEQEGNVDTLLWVLTVASAVAPSNESRAWWILQLAEVCENLEVIAEADLRRRMQRVAWTDVFFDDRLGGLWDEVLQSWRVRKPALGDVEVEQMLINTFDSQMLEMQI